VETTTLKRGVYRAIAIAAALIVGGIAVLSMILGGEGYKREALQTAAAFIVALASAAAFGGEDALVRSATFVGGALVCLGLLLHDASRGSSDFAALPLASQGAYVLLLGCAAAAYRVIAGIPGSQR
jgi:hypothetical protein